MRNKDTLFAFDDIAILLQYLYMDENHKILIHNSINVPLELFMVVDDNESVWIKCRNLNFPDIPAANYTENFHPETMLRVIDQLKTEAPVEFPEKFENRWEEIKITTQINLSINR